VVPLNLKLCPEATGARRLFNFGLTSSNSARLFGTDGAADPHSWLNRINFSSRRANPDRVSELISLLEALERPKAFVVRLLNPDLPEYVDVQNFFDTVVQQVVENEMNYKLVVVDGNQPILAPRIDEEIFTKLHRSSIVIADITGSRPNCFLELGYALGRGTPVMVTAKEKTSHPFDITTLAAHHWKTDGTAEDRRRPFRVHWDAIRTRPRLVPMEPLIP
jgi:hypothetical protein